MVQDKSKICLPKMLNQHHHSAGLCGLALCELVPSTPDRHRLKTDPIQKAYEQASPQADSLPTAPNDDFAKS